MKVEVWDTYVSRKDGETMHFDILVEAGKSDSNKVFNFGNKYLSSKPFETKELTSNECQFCHLEQVSEKVKKEIATNGYSIIELENCV